MTFHHGISNSKKITSQEPHFGYPKNLSKIFQTAKEAQAKITKGHNFPINNPQRGIHKTTAYTKVDENGLRITQNDQSEHQESINELTDDRGFNIIPCHYRVVGYKVSTNLQNIGVNMP